MAEEDRERLARFPSIGQWDRVHGGRDKGDQAHAAPWLRFIAGHNADYPEAILRANYAETCRRLERLRQDDGDPREWDVHHWQEINPVTCEGLVQLTLGAPPPIYHGGLLHCRVRYFDPTRQRPGLPPGIAALVERITPQGILLRLVNTDPLEGQEVVVQAGAFGEHSFTEVQRLDEAGQPTDDGAVVNGRASRCGWVRRHGPAGRDAALRPPADLRLAVLDQETHLGEPWSAAATQLPATEARWLGHSGNRPMATECRGNAASQTVDARWPAPAIARKEQRSAAATRLPRLLMPDGSGTPAIPREERRSAAATRLPNCRSPMARALRAGWWLTAGAPGWRWRGHPGPRLRRG